MAPRRKKDDSAVLNAILGLYPHRQPLEVPLRGLLDGNNFRIDRGELTNENIGWTDAGLAQLNGPVMLIEQFRTRALGDKTVFATNLDLYHYNGTDMLFITPIYATGTVEVSGTAVTGTGTAWDTGTPKNAKAGDFISFGAADEDDPDATWWEIDEVTSDTAIVLVEDAGTVGAGASYTIRKVYTGDTDDLWEAEPFINGPSNIDWLYLTNGVDPITRWDGAGPAVYSSVGFTCKHLAAYQNMMIYGNLVQGGVTLPVDIVNSDVGDPEEDGAGLSEQFKVHDDAGEIQRMMPIGDSLALHSERNITVAQFVGDPVVFTFRKAISDAGWVAPKLGLDFGDYHEFLSADGMYRFDGAAIISSGEQLWHDIIHLVDPSRQHQSLAFISEQFGEAMWIPALSSDGTTGTAESCFTEHYIEQLTLDAPVPYSKRDFPFLSIGLLTQGATLTWDTVVGSWDSSGAEWNDISLLANFPLILAGDASGNIFRVNSGQSADGTALTSFVRFGRRPTGDGRMKGLISRIYPFARDVVGTGADLSVILHLTNHAQGETTEGDADMFDLSLPEGGHFVSPFRAARFFEVEFRMSDDVTGGWGLSGYDWDGRDGGFR